MRRDPWDEGRRWLDQASRDLDDARYLHEGGRWSLTCFHAQQAAEKALKGLLILRGVEDPWGHSVADLDQLAASLDEEWKSSQVDVAGLDLYYIPTRYPDSLPGGLPADAFGEDDADRALRKAQGVLDAVTRAFSP
ncbi:MAG: HEPN domain-containing protein [Egibacteraceae bacterium]